MNTQFVPSSQPAISAQHIVITGATSGIGEALAMDYTHEGHVVYALGRNADKLAVLAKHGMHTQVLDVTEREAVLAWFASLSRVDLAIFVAGNCTYIDMPEFDSRVVSDMMQTNVASMAHCIQGVLPHLIRSQGHLVGVGSASAYVPFVRAEAYGASKAAVHYMLDTLRLSLAPLGVAVSTVVPGFVDTPLTQKNDFSMPFMIEAATASGCIRKGIASQQSEIHFPKQLTLPLKLLHHLPQGIWDTIAKRMAKKMSGKAQAQLSNKTSYE